MVKVLVSFVLITFAQASFSQSKAPALNLSQQDVASLVLKQGPKVKEVNLKYQQYGLAPVQSHSAYDWKLTAETGYEYDKTENLSFSGYSKYERLKNKLNLSKALLTGTNLSLDLARTAQKADVTTASTSTTAASLLTLDSLTFTVEQALWNNSFGRSDRAAIRKADLDYKALSTLRVNELEDVVLETLRAFWNAYVTQENFKESLASRERYEKLVSAVKRKNAVGYTSPGELAQVQAEYESRIQTVKTASIEYLKATDLLLTLLDLPSGSEINFIVPTEIPSVPKLNSYKLDELRAIRSQNLKVTAAEDAVTSAQSKNHPTLNLVAKAGATGMSDTGDASYSELASGSRPLYYAGLKFQYNFGSGVQDEDYINKRLALDQEQTKLHRMRQEETNKELESERKVNAAYVIAMSAKVQKGLREKAMQELNRSFNQGRTDISALIDSMNKFFASEIQYVRAIGDYQIALNEWASTRDELIPDKKEDQ